jgi:hypothetical protein
MSELENEVSALMTAVRDLTEALLAEPDEVTRVP